MRTACHNVSPHAAAAGAISDISGGTTQLLIQRCKPPEVDNPWEPQKSTWIAASKPSGRMMHKALPSSKPAPTAVTCRNAAVQHSVCAACIRHHCMKLKHAATAQPVHDCLPAWPEQAPDAVVMTMHKCSSQLSVVIAARALPQLITGAAPALWLLDA
jgi:hypothetical protein